MSSPYGTASGTDGGVTKIGMPFDKHEELGGRSREDHEGFVILRFLSIFNGCQLEAKSTCIARSTALLVPYCSPFS